MRLSRGLIWHSLLLPTASQLTTQEWCDRNPKFPTFPTNQSLNALSYGFCRSWTFSSIVTNDKLLMLGLDGGAVRGDGNNTRVYMVDTNLSAPFDLTDGTNWRLTSLPAEIHKFKGGVMWENSSNTTLFSYGGQFPGKSAPKGNDFYQYDVQNNRWSVVSTLLSMQRLTDGASINVPELHKGFFLGGYQSKETTEDVPDDGLYRFATSMLSFDTNTNNPSMVDAPFLPSQFGTVSYIPTSGGGVLVYFGGETPSSPAVDSVDGLNVNSWDYVWIYDIANNKWHRQNTSGKATPRTEFCASTVYDKATKSWQIWTIGGANYKTTKVLDTVSVLSIPSFQWFTAAPARTRMSVSCQRVGSQIFVIGGRQNFTGRGGEDYGSIAYIYDVNKQAAVDSFDPKLTTYTPPDFVVAAISARATPTKWAHPDVQKLFIAKNASSGPNKQISGAEIASAVVGTILGVAIAAGLIIFCMRRKQKSRKQATESTPHSAEQEQSEHDAETREKIGDLIDLRETVIHELPASPSSEQLSPTLHEVSPTSLHELTASGVPEMAASIDHNEMDAREQIATKLSKLQRDRNYIERRNGTG
ncbi:hypothetical protein BT63DRAFT_460768 [Microthyrium microscopicum]|uniref:Kelch repeat protein n=1 Tax=Microthyrium microscopicum TaxID=703497 RepID=A0A6A6TXE7_9PEZI|nr:hypothetical protein BT63DRAFT_460768 [Microthyrium microscopicum]